VSLGTSEYYQSLKELPPDLLAGVLKEDLLLVKQVFLPGCALEIEKLTLDFDLEAWRNFFAKMYLSFRSQSITFILPEDLAFALTNSSFGKTMFRLHPLANATLKIRQFIEYLNAVNPKYISVICHFNETEAKQEEIKCKQPNDSEIEEFNRNLGLSLEQSPEERILLNLASDVSPAQFESVVKDLQLVALV
jgi:hypothetical protein